MREHNRIVHSFTGVTRGPHAPTAWIDLGPADVFRIHRTVLHYRDLRERSERSAKKKQQKAEAKT